MFTGFPEETNRFFLDLRFHNDGVWFRENRERYLRDVQAPFYALIGDLTPVLQEIDPLVEIRPHKLLSRIRRDTRFSKDKSPYRDHLWIWFKRGGEERWMSIGYWFEYGPDRLSWGLSSWGENRPLMDRFRRELAAEPGRYSGIIRSCGLPERHIALTGESFRRLEVPPNLPDELRRWYMLKEPTLMQTRYKPGEAAGRGLLGHVAADFRAMAPVYRLLRGMQEALAEESEADPDGKPAVPPKKKMQDEW